MLAKVVADVINNISQRYLIWQANEDDLLSAADIDPLLDVTVEDLEQSKKRWGKHKKKKTSYMLSGESMKQRTV